MTIAALLDIPKGGCLCLDAGAVDIVLQRDDFVALCQLPGDGNDDDDNDDGGFHLLTVRAGNPQSTTTTSSQAAAMPAITVGFVLPKRRRKQQQHQHNAGDTHVIATTTTNAQPSELILVRRYDPQTQEVSSTPVDATTVANLQQQIFHGRIDPQRLLHYSQVVAPQRAQAWTNGLAHFISQRLLFKRGIQSGETKIVPGTFTSGDDEEMYEDTTTGSGDKIVDGVALSYPSIPVLESSSSTTTQQKRRRLHQGTQRYMARLNPPERTQIYMHACPADFVLPRILEQYYNNTWQDLIGDVQLSYVMFLQLHCYTSLEHWRDLVAMLSCVSWQAMVQHHLPLYAKLVTVLTSQLMTMDEGFWQDAEWSDENFLAPCLHRLGASLKRVASREETSESTLVNTFCELIRTRCPVDESSMNDETRIDEAFDGATALDSDDDDDDDDDGPVVVSSDEIAASMNRSSSGFHPVTAAQNLSPAAETTSDGSGSSWREQFPILSAAVMPHEDVLMTCARALDDAVDVSLVREAAAYLQEVEQKKATG